MSTPRLITVDLPERATIFELAMTSPTEGWLVGGVFAPDHHTLQSGLIMVSQMGFEMDASWHAFVLQQHDATPYHLLPNFDHN